MLFLEEFLLFLNRCSLRASGIIEVRYLRERKRKTTGDERGEKPMIGSMNLSLTAISFAESFVRVAFGGAGRVGIAV